MLSVSPEIGGRDEFSIARAKAGIFLHSFSQTRYFFMKISLKVIESRHQGLDGRFFFRS